MNCHHCGQDYAGQHYPSDHKPVVAWSDPFVCNNCRRDTNPNVQASTWKPPTRDTSGIQVKAYPVRRVCQCGAEREGWAFTEPTAGETFRGMCEACMDKEDAILRELTKPRAEPITTKDMELEPPRPVGDGLDDVYPIDRKMLQAGER